MGFLPLAFHVRCLTWSRTALRRLWGLQPPTIRCSQSQTFNQPLHTRLWCARATSMASLQSALPSQSQPAMLVSSLLPLSVSVSVCVSVCLCVRVCLLVHMYDLHRAAFILTHTRTHAHNTYAHAAPSAPGAPYVRVIGGENVVLWDRPEQPNGNITQYELWEKDTSQPLYSGHPGADLQFTLPATRATVSLQITRIHVHMHTHTHTHAHARARTHAEVETRNSQRAEVRRSSCAFQPHM